jgi:heptosyltransferase-2
MRNIDNADNILVIRFSSLGDILLTTPFLRVLRNKYPNSNIDYLVKNNFLDAIKLNPNINSIFSWQSDSELKNKVQKLKKNNYDLVIDLQNNLRSKKVVKILNTNSVSYKKPNIKKFLLVHTKINYLKDRRSIPQRFVDVVPNLKLDKKGLELFLPDKNINNKSFSNKTIGFAPGAFHYTKMWPIEYFVELGNKLVEDGYSVLIFGGKSDQKLCRELQTKIKNSLDLSTDNNLFETATNMVRCKLIVCNDSGLMHTATAVGVPVISIFGSTVQEFGFAPFGVRSLVIENTDLSCRPCSHIGKAKCKKKHFKCMNDLKPSLVYSQLKKFEGEL